MAGYLIVNEELNKINYDFNIDNLFGIKSIIDFIIDKYKQILLLFLIVLIILAVDYITYYNNLIYNMAPVIPGVNQQQTQPNKIKSNAFKNKPRKFKK
jgi:type III secretory pathway component EscU